MLSPNAQTDIVSAVQFAMERFHTEAAACAQDVAHAMTRPSLIYRPRIFPDGNQWCALYGVDLQEGVCGFGDSPEKAAADFDRAWTESLTARGAA